MSVAAASSATVKGVTYTVEGGFAKVAAAAGGLRSATVAAKVKIAGKVYKVTGVKAGAFKGCKKLKSLVIKSKGLTKKGVKGCLKGSKVKTVKVKVGGKGLNKRFAKKYKRLFAKKVCGKRVAVK